LRARFALVGFFSLVASPVDVAAVSKLEAELSRRAQVGAWWLTVDQSFVSAWLILRGLQTVRPLPRWDKVLYAKRLLSAAELYSEIDPAVELLLRLDVLGQGNPRYGAR
jgi:hypothetical protein